MLKQRIRKAPVKDKNEVICTLCTGKKVLDVGCIGQDFSMTGPDWLHNRIRKVSTSVTGVDIVRDKIGLLNGQGYHMLHVSELDSIMEEFDVIIMADVIEHVDNPVEFLKYYARFLSQNGVMLVSTPNANRAINFISILFLNNYSVNDEHTLWLCPKTMHEVITRSGLKLKEIYWLKRYYSLRKLSIISWLITVISELFSLIRRSFNQNFVVILSK